ncbi:hypothetical protein SGFS_100530 [Streptomyces graminofaciens]|uniref:Uncharacterized protein n=1 Tax=Streptomyces graminofaciens TaxID=68212 RepID=A0ABN5VZE2_9ACTN|nr:hypothetical protein [Streptomyces graminofaciens]BBC38759.1 hypothetical protein SGFS_100530 [Streptomyces graminofaciens]
MPTRAGEFGQNTRARPFVDRGVTWCDDREFLLSGRRTWNARDCSCAPPVISAYDGTATA